MEREKINTIQETGKILKLHSVISIIIFIIGFFIIINNGESEAGKYMFFGGIIYYMITKIKIWWNHK